MQVNRWRPNPDAAYDRLTSGRGPADDLAYLVKWRGDTCVLEEVVEAGEPLRLLVGLAAEFGAGCVTEFAPDEAERWLVHFGRPHPDGE